MTGERIRGEVIQASVCDASLGSPLDDRHKEGSGRRVASVLAGPVSLRARMRCRARSGDLSRLRFDVCDGMVEDPDIVVVYEALTPAVMRYVEAAFRAGAIFILDLAQSGANLWARAPAELLERAVALADVVTTDSPERAVELRRELPIRRLEVIPDTIWPLPARALSLCDPPGKLSVVWFGTVRELGAFEALLPTLRSIRDIELRALLLSEPDAPRIDLARARAHHPNVSFEEVPLDRLGAFLTSSHVAVVPAERAPGAEGLPAWKLGTCALWGVPCMYERLDATRDEGALGAYECVDELPARLERLRSREPRAEMLSAVQTKLWERFSPLKVADTFRELLISTVSAYASAVSEPRISASAPVEPATPVVLPMRSAAPAWVTPIAFRESRVVASLFSRMITDDVAASSLELLESQLARWVGAAYTVAVHNPRAALVLALAEHGIGRGDEVIVPALAPRSVPEAVLQLGAEPVLCEIDPRTLAIDPLHAEVLLGDHTRAMVVVDFAGQPAPVDALERIAERYGIACIELAVDGVGGLRAGSALGAQPLSVLGLDCMGFGETTSIGFVTCTDASTYERLRQRRERPGSMAVVDAPAAPVVPYTQMSRAVLDQLESQCDHHAAIVGQYERLLGTDPERVASVVRPLSPARMAPWGCLVRSQFRDALRAELAAWKIATELPGALCHRDPLLRHARRGDLRESERVHGQLLALPVSRGLSVRQRLQIDRALRSFLDHFES